MKKDRNPFDPICGRLIREGNVPPNEAAEGRADGTTRGTSQAGQMSRTRGRCSLRRRDEAGPARNVLVTAGASINGPEYGDRRLALARGLASRRRFCCSLIEPHPACKWIGKGASQATFSPRVFRYQRGHYQASD